VKREHIVCVPEIGALLVLALQVSAQENLDVHPPVPRADIEFLSGRETPVCKAYTDPLRRREWDDPAFHVDLGDTHYPFGLVEPWILLEPIENFLWERDVNAANYFLVTQMTEWQRTPEQLADARRRFHDTFETELNASGYQVGRIDIDNDGTLDNVFFTTRQSGSTLLVLNTARTQVDIARSERLLAHPSRAAAGWPDVRPPREGEPSKYALWPGLDAYHSTEYHVFVYDGATYYRFLWTVHPDHSTREWIQRGTEHIFRIDGAEKAEVCEFRVVL